MRVRREGGRIIAMDLAPARVGFVVISSKWDAKSTDNVLVSSFEPVGEHLIAKAGYAAGVLLEQFALWQPAYVFVEDYPFGNNTSGSRGRAEFAGVIKHALWREQEDWLPDPVNISSARKTLLGKVPVGKGLAKKVCFEALKSLGFLLTCDDESDALVVGNHGASTLGRAFISAPTVE